jgi:hypothetical protein
LRLVVEQAGEPRSGLLISSTTTEKLLAQGGELAAELLERVERCAGGPGLVDGFDVPVEVGGEGSELAPGLAVELGDRAGEAPAEEGAADELGEGAGNYLRGAWALGKGMICDMARTLEQIEDEVLSLSEESRARLMERLLLSLQSQATPDDEDIARAWVEEAERRDHEMSSGEEAGLPAEKVFSKLRSSLR